MTGDRLKKIGRIVEVQAQMHRLAEWRLVRLRQQEDELLEEQERLVQSLGENSILHGLFVATMARRLGRLAAETKRVTDTREAQQTRVFDEAMRLKRTERVAQKLGREERVTEERRELQAFLEGIASKGDASAT